MRFLRRVVLVSLLLTLFGWLGFRYRESYHSQVDPHLQSGQEALNALDFEKAQAEFEVCLLKAPENAEIRLSLAQAARRAGRFDLAKKHLQASEKIAGQSPTSILESALLQAQQGDLLHSQDFLVTTLKNGSPESPLILEGLARGAMQNRLLGSAMNYLDQLIALEPNHFLAYKWRGQVWENLADPDKALLDYGRAVELRPDNLETRMCLAEVYLRLNRADEALEHIEFVRKQRPNNETVLFGLARCSRQRGDYEIANEFLAKILAKFPNHLEALLVRGSILLEMGKLQEAEPVLYRAAKIAPYDRESNFLLARCSRLLGKESDEKRYTARVLEIDGYRKNLRETTDKIRKSPNDPELRRQAAILCMQCNRDGEALSWLQGSLQINPNYKPTHVALADFYDRIGRHDLAVEHRAAAKDR